MGPLLLSPRSSALIGARHSKLDTIKTTCNIAELRRFLLAYWCPCLMHTTLCTYFPGSTVGIKEFSDLYIACINLGAKYQTSTAAHDLTAAKPLFFFFIYCALQWNWARDNSSCNRDRVRLTLVCTCPDYNINVWRLDDRSSPTGDAVGFGSQNRQQAKRQTGVAALCRN